MKARTGRGTIATEDDEEDQGGWPILRTEATLRGRDHWSPASAVKHGPHATRASNSPRQGASAAPPPPSATGSGKWAPREVFGMVLLPVRVLWAAPWEVKRRAFG